MLTLIVTSYNQLSTLRMLLASLERQSVGGIAGFEGIEILVADDGSSDGTAEFCAGYSRLQLTFITQEDQGYRKARILNQAIDRARGDYLIFLDADVILHPRFIEDHLALRRPGAFVCGRRVDLGPELTASVNEELVRAGFFDGLSLRLVRSGWAKDTENWKRAIRVRSQFLRKIMGYEKPIDILGSNLGLWRSDLIEVNGFNEALEAYWGEDGDLFVRLRNSGKRAVNAKGMCIQFHLFHKRRQPSAENIALVERLLQRKDYVRAERGFSDRFGGQGSVG